MNSVQVAGSINGSEWPMIVDTGSNQTILRQDVLEDKDIPVAAEELSDVTGGRSRLWGPVNVEFEVGGLTSRHDVYVSASIAEPCILGLDYLRQNGCSMDLSKMTLNIRGRVIPMTAGKPSTAEFRAFRVSVRKSVTIPPQSETLVTCKPMKNTFGVPGMIEAGAGPKQGTLVARTLVDTSKQLFPVLMANLTDKPIRIRAKTEVGSCEPVIKMPTTNTSPSTAKDDRTMPAHLHDLFERSCGDCLPKKWRTLDSCCWNTLTYFPVEIMIWAAPN